MAWNLALGRKERKEASRHMRSEVNRIAIEEPERKGKKSKKAKKLFAIEYRYTQKYWNRFGDNWWFRRRTNNWRVHNKYATEKQREQALESLNKRQDDAVEYRSVDFS